MWQQAVGSLVVMAAANWLARRAAIAHYTRIDLILINVTTEYLLEGRKRWQLQLAW